MKFLHLSIYIDCAALNLQVSLFERLDELDGDHHLLLLETGFSSLWQRIQGTQVFAASLSLSHTHYMYTRPLFQIRIHL